MQERTMKRAVALAMGIALVSAASFAQTNQVLSRNAVGYVRINTVRSNFHYLAHNFLNISGGPTTVTNLIGNQVPNGSAVFLWNKAAQAYIAENLIFSGWSPGTNRITPGQGMWLRIAPTGPSNNYTVFFLGEVPDRFTQPTSTVQIVQSFNMVGFPYPIDVAFTNTELAKKAVSGDAAFFWTPQTQSYRPENRIFSGWTPGTNVVHPGEGFWFRKNSAGTTNWIEAKPYTWP
jgi:hypothetical protein